jgi:hypothetical protein
VKVWISNKTLDNSPFSCEKIPTRKFSWGKPEEHPYLINGYSKVTSHPPSFTSGGMSKVCINEMQAKGFNGMV